MKKILLSLMLIGTFVFVKAQAVLNEIYFNPATGESEYIEIFNSGAPENLNCYTLIIKYNTGATSGFYVINYPSINLASNDWSVVSSSLPFNYQNGTYVGGSKDFSWNSLNLPGSGGYFKQFQRTGTTYTEITPPVNTNDILQTLPSGDGAKYITLLYKNGILVNGLIINGGTTAPLGLTGMPDLDVPTDGTCAAFTTHFSLITNNQLEYMTPAIGSSNGAFRTNDGKCGSWQKASQKKDNTPGTPNGPSGAISGAIVLGGDIPCAVTDGKRSVNYFVVNATTNAAAYPMVLLLYFDNGSVPGQYDSDDDFIEQHTLNTAPAASDPNTVFHAELLGGNKNAIVIAKSTAGCFESIFNIDNSCTPLPVKFKSFNANRTTTSNVSITWTTASEQNSKGFNVQKNVNGEWKTIAFVPSQALGGNSSYDINYSFKDANTEKGITQYRVQQVDLDGKFAYTDIRAIRGEGTVGKIIVYPNPSADGKVNVVFEDNTVRDIQVNDMQGKVIKSYKGITNNILVIEKLTSGFYTIKITNRNTAASSVEKVVVK
jgi:hypothetical protein